METTARISARASEADTRVFLDICLIYPIPEEIAVMGMCRTWSNSTYGPVLPDMSTSFTLKQHSRNQNVETYCRGCCLFALTGRFVRMFSGGRKIHVRRSGWFLYGYLARLDRARFPHRGYL